MLTSPSKADSERVRGYSAYASAINYLVNGNEDKARAELEKLNEQWKELDISIDIDASIKKMHTTIEILSEKGLITEKKGKKVIKKYFWLP
ncbi:hypothetical protein [Candidatus Berkiella aquae]|uniref:Uncharacterized protein n=1 Tax=Candidatus Berkiella aquae TaxID=295108 RepID=A0A0Q9YW34_9GAMM|nr:hypothetical protein [Candidatus Berkiella aquae]MCS5711176.1 hypothetical protein [Candidatus Berkiella aquae]